MIEQLHASAGSGKTYRLTRRFLRLLMQSGSSPPACGRADGEGYGPESILAITFTNKAAAEMKERVLTALKSLALGLPDPEFTAPCDRVKARAWLERILKHFQTLNIRTIDSLLNQLARLFALELGLPPDFETSLDEDMVFEAVSDAVTGRMAGEDQHLESVVARMADALTLIEGAGGFWLADRVEIRLRTVFRHMLSKGLPPVCDPDELHREMEALRQALTQSARTLEKALASAGARPASNFASFLASLGRVASLKDIPDSAYAAKPSLEDCLLKDSKPLVTPGLEELYRALGENCLRARNRGALLAKALAWHPFLEFGALLMDAFETYRRDKALALLTQLPGSVAGLLSEAGGVPEAYCRLGSRLHHLLIDEFQDTSLSQWEVLSQLAQECLSKGGSLFYVGDVKQAIYGWRGGDAALFEAAARQPGLANLAGQRRESLDRNWRSAPEVVNFNNRVFSSLASPDTARMVAMVLLQNAPEPIIQALASDLAASFADATQDLPPGKEEGKGFVSVRRLPGEGPSEHEKAVREAMAELFTKDLSKRRDLSDIAVLTRTNGEAAKAAQWLVDLDIPVVTENSLRLAEHPVVRGAVSFLSFLDYPPDNMALWGFLSCRELFCRSQRLPRQMLSDWLAAQDKGPLYRKFQRDFPEAWQRLVEPFLGGGGPASPYDLVQELFNACGVFEAYPDDEVFLRRFLELVHNAETQGFGSLSSFLEFWNEKGRQEKIPQPEDARAVRILTIHKAKGLQFPVTVVPFHVFPFRQPDGLVQAGEEGRTFLAPMCREAGEQYHQSAARALHEQLNLLYVAWTRPEQELHLFLPGHQKMVNRHPVAKAAEIMLLAAGIGPGETEAAYGSRPPKQAELVSAPEPRQRAPEPPAPEAPLSASAPLDWLPGLKILRRELGDPAERLRVSERKRGIVLHSALERLEPGGDPLPAVMRAMASHGVHDDDMALELAEGLEWLATQDFFPDCQRLGLREAELMDVDGAVHRPDLIAFTEDETLILDYKTGREDPSHHAQLARYLRLTAALPRAMGRPVRGLLVYIDMKTIRQAAPGETQ
ncbi:MAG: UvrD-helicase domain-containing protein [Thermodesulfobacteriota bacterium]